MDQPALTPPRTALTTHRPVAILMVVLAVCVFGWMSYQQLALTLMPDISYPTLTVRTEYPGTAPEEVESLIARPLERELGILSHLVSISSISKAGQADVALEFAWDIDMNVVAQDIREKVDRVRLPENATRPLLLRYDPSLDPIMRIGLAGPQNLYELRNLAELEIRRELESVTGIAAVKIKGGLEEEIHVELNENKLAVMGLDIAQVNSRLAQGNVNLPGGNLREGQTQYLIRTLNEFQSLDEIASLIVAQSTTAEVRLRDIARVYRSHKDRQVITRMNGRESVEIEIYKEADANIVSVARAVRNRLYGLPKQQAYVAQQEIMANTDSSTVAAEELTKEESSDASKALEAAPEQPTKQTIEHLKMTDFLSYQLPSGASLEVLSDQSVFIVESIREVQNSALIGGAMAILVLFVFLRNIVHTLIIGLTIPVSIIATFAPMKLFDVSLNLMSLGGLALGIGMLVDNSIVVLESIFRCREEGDDLVSATIRGSGEVGSAVFASTLTTSAVFFPIVFVEGIAGQVFGDMALTVVFSLLASLCVALFFIPMLASRQIKKNLALTQRTDFLRLETLTLARQRWHEKERSWLSQMMAIGMVLPSLVYEFGWRLLLALATIIVAVVKWVVILVFEGLWLGLKPIEYFWVKPTISWHRQMAKWASSSRLGPWTIFEYVWPNILSLQASEELGRDMESFWAWIWRRPGLLGRLGRLLFMPLVVLYLLVRLVFYAALRLVGVVLHITLLLIALFAIVLATLVAMILQPLFVLPLWGAEKGLGLLQKGYPVLLSMALKQRVLVVMVAVGTFCGAWFGLLPQIGRELIPQVHQGEFYLDIRLPVGTPLAKTAEVVNLVETVAQQEMEIEQIATTVGSDNSATAAADEGEHTSRITIKLQEGVDAVAEAALISRLRRSFKDLPEVDIELAYPALFSFKTPVEVEIRGYDLDILQRFSQQCELLLAQVPGLADVKSSLQTGNPEIQIIYDRQRLADYGLELRSVAELVRNKVQGRVPTDFRQDDRQIDVLVRLRETDRLGPSELRRLVVNPGAEVPISLSAVAQITVDEGPSEIRRIDQDRAALLTANIHNIDLATAAQRIQQQLDRVIFPAGISYLISGQSKEMETSLKSLLFMLLLAVFLVYIVMASQFESLIHPLVIMFTVPLALIGVIIGLSLTQTSINIVVFIGLIMLAGIVVNNAIVLVDYINRLRQVGMAKTEAIIQAGSARLRPILMTTLTTILGLSPLALGLGEGAEIRTPMALTVIAGLISSTLLTLVVIPTVYSLVDRNK